MNTLPAKKKIIIPANKENIGSKMKGGIINPKMSYGTNENVNLVSNAPGITLTTSLTRLYSHIAGIGT